MSKFREETGEKLARVEYALKQFAAEKGLSAMAIQCYSAMEMLFGVVPCYVMGRITTAGTMASCETDLYGALTMLVEYKAALSPRHPILWIGR